MFIGGRKMYKLTPLQKETMAFLKAQIDEARSHSINFENMGKEALTIDANTFQFFTRNPYARRKCDGTYIKKIGEYWSYQNIRR